jgi:hypothetical protein
MVDFFTLNQIFLTILQKRNFIFFLRQFIKGMGKKKKSPNSSSKTFKIYTSEVIIYCLLDQTLTIGCVCNFLSQFWKKKIPKKGT